MLPTPRLPPSSPDPSPTSRPGADGCGPPGSSSPVAGRRSALPELAAPKAVRLTADPDASATPARGATEDRGGRAAGEPGDDGSRDVRASTPIPAARRSPRSARGGRGSDGGAGPRLRRRVDDGHVGPGAGRPARLVRGSGPGAPHAGRAPCMGRSLARSSNQASRAASSRPDVAVVNASSKPRTSAAIRSATASGGAR